MRRSTVQSLPLQLGVPAKSDYVLVLHLSTICLDNFLQCGKILIVAKT